MDCPEGYIPSGNRCVKGFTQALNWFDAEDQCQLIMDNTGKNVDGHLVSIHSESKNVQLTQYFQEIRNNFKNSKILKFKIAFLKVEKWWHKIAILGRSSKTRRQQSNRWHDVVR